MADYQFATPDATAENGPVWRLVDKVKLANTLVPSDDWNAYVDWVGQGNTPDPFVQTPTHAYTLYDHENRIRALEGQPLLDWGMPSSKR